MSYIILATKSVPTALNEIVSNAPQDLVEFLQQTKVVHLAKNDLMCRKGFYSEVVITDYQSCEFNFFSKQSIIYPHRVFILRGKPVHVIPKNVIGFFENANQLKENLIGYVQYLNLSKKFILNHQKSIFLSDIICVEVKHRKLLITTVEKTYNLGYRTLKSFMLQANSHFFCVNRSIIVNLDYISFLAKDKMIKLQQLKREISCSKEKYRILIEKISDNLD